MPPAYEMISFVAYAHGYKKAKEEAERERTASSGQSHPGGAIVMLFPDGKIRAQG